MGFFLLWVSISSSAIFVSIFLKIWFLCSPDLCCVKSEHVFASFHSWSFNINITIFKFKIANLNNKVNEIWIGIAFFSESTSQEPKKLRADYIENYKGIW